MQTITITKKVGGRKNQTLKGATRKMNWAADYEYFGDQDVNDVSLQGGCPAAMEYLVEEGDEIVEVDSAGNEMARVVFD